MTEKLFYADSYIKEFSATVVSLKQVGEHFECILDKTAFFPTEAGQSCDLGRIDCANVLDVKEIDGNIVHTLDKNPVTDNVFCEIDWKKRFRNMQNHSGEHIVSGLIKSLFGFDNVGFHLGSEDVTIDFNGTLTDSQLEEIERKANEAVVANIEIKAVFPTMAELEKMDFRSKIELKEGLRIVRIGDYDSCACCAPHVKMTGEIGVIKLLNSIHYKGGTRLHILCGLDALSDYGMRFKNVKNISSLLSVKHNESYEAVFRLNEALAEEKAKNGALRREIQRLRAEALPVCEKNRVVFCEEDDYNFLRNYANLLIKKTAEITAVFSGNDIDGYKYVIGSDTVDLSARVKDVNLKLRGSGGGRTNMIQGSVSATKEEIISYFE
jgi:alanyl-tRNA synthetase